MKSVFHSHADIVLHFHLKALSSDRQKNPRFLAVLKHHSADDVDALILTLEQEMQQAAKNLEFEQAADLRDQIKALQKLIVLEV